MARPLGENQKLALRYLAERNNGTWYPGAGWVWENVSTTVRLLGSLVGRGLATREERDRMIGKHPEPYPFFKITEAGRELARSSARKV